VSKDLQVANSKAFPNGVVRLAAPGAAPYGGRASQERPRQPYATGSEVRSDFAIDSPGALAAALLDPIELRAWRAFLVTHARVARKLEADLLAHADLPLAEYDVLFQLGQAENRRLRMNELAERVLLSRAGITRLVDRLVVDGFVSRLKCATDARGFYAVLTDQGMARLLHATPGHMAAVRRYFLESFTRTEIETLGELLERAFPAE
jgi:DNA-binding MarR family transcriptional regulator